ncbi:MAG: PqqD family protein, partial [Thermoanaerobaculia bacterium]
MRRSRKDPLGEINLLELAPVRVARWQQVEDRVVVDRPKPHARFPRILLEWLSHLMAVKSLRLDEVGSFAWQLLDGEHTVGQVAVAVRERFGDAVEPAEERLGHLVRLLRQEGLLAYPE